MTSIVELLPNDQEGQQLVLNRYRPICRLGKGGQADVYLATTPGPADFHRLVVIKVLREREGVTTEGLSAFLEEAKLSARLNHPNVVQTLEVSEYRGRPCLVMEHLEGQSLDRVLRATKTGTPPSDTFWARIISDALAGLSYAHELADYERRPMHIVHRDISPQNIFVTYHGQVKVLDFGIAQSSGSANVDPDGIIRGKVSYMSPEQARGEQVDARTDLFAMGVVFWELLTGRRLLEEEGPSALYKLLSEDIPRVSDVSPGVDPRLDDIVSRALERDPSRRYQSAATMREAIESFLSTVTDAPRADDVGQLLQHAFAAHRDGVRRKVREYMNADRHDMTTGTYSLTVDSMRVPMLMSHQLPAAQGFAGRRDAGSRSFWLTAAVVIVALSAAAMWVASTATWAQPEPIARAAVPAVTGIWLESQPLGATVRDGDAVLGKTPLSIESPEAALTVNISAPGFVTAQATLAVGEVANRLVVLAPSGAEAAMSASAVASGSLSRPRPRTRRPVARVRRRGRRAYPPDAPPAEKTPPEATETPVAAPPPPVPAPRTPPPRAPKVKVIEEEKPKVRVID